MISNSILLPSLIATLSILVRSSLLAIVIAIIVSTSASSTGV